MKESVLYLRQEALLKHQTSNLRATPWIRDPNRNSGLIIFLPSIIRIGSGARVPQRSLMLTSVATAAMCQGPSGRKKAIFAFVS